MRIAYVCADPGVPVLGTKGCSIHVQEVLRALRRRGADVELFATRLGGPVDGQIDEISIHRLPAIHKGDAAQRERQALQANRRLRDALAASGPFDLVYERYSLWSYAGMEYAADLGTPGVLEVNAPLIKEQAEHRVLVDRRAAEHVRTRVHHAAKAVVAVSQQVAAAFCTGAAGGAPIHVVPNGVNTSRFAPDVPPILPRERTFTLGFVGSLKPWHGVEQLLEAFAGLRCASTDERLLIIGDGPEGDRLRALAKQADDYSNSIEFVGSVPHDQIPGWLSSMDVAVAPYPDLADFYFSPLKIYEYMSSGLPVVASRIGQVAQVIRHGENGWLCRPGDPADLCRALKTLRQDTRLRESLGAAARSTILQGHSWNAVVDTILRLAGVAHPAPLIAQT